MSKIFIISLPRSGTTSACLYLLDLGFKVAHNAYKPSVISRADVLADTPIYNDYPELDALYPQAKFIYLLRPEQLWLASIRRLLMSMRKQWARDKDFFEAEIQRCFTKVFPNFDLHLEYSDEYLIKCYSQHICAVKEHFASRQEKLLFLNIDEQDAGITLQEFCTGFIDKNQTKNLPHVNRGRRITYWQSIDHLNKVESK